jgi:hypothetical protein
MGIFIDLVGASGATYRFRAWREGDQAPMAGNFAVVVKAGRTVELLMLGVTIDLSKAQTHAAAAGLAGKPLFVRLNVARATRRQEHDDIVANYAPPQIFETGSGDAT